MRLLYNKLNNFFYRLKKIGFDVILVRDFILLIIFYPILFHLIDFDIGLSLSHLIAIYGIVGGILIVIFIFVITKDKEHPYKVEIFLNETKLINVISLFLISLILFLFPEKNILAVSFLALLGHTIYAIIKIVTVILNSEELWRKHINLFKGRIKEAIKFSQMIQLNTKGFHSFIMQSNNKIKWLKPRPFNYISLQCLEEGTMVDIKVKELKDVIDNIRSHELKKTESDQIEQLIESIQIQRKNKDENIIFHVDIGDKIRRGSDLLSYNRDIQIDSYKIQKALNNNISIKKTTTVDELEMELENYKTMIKKYIEKGNTFQFERYFKLYFNLAEEFLNQEKPYSYEEAKREMPYFGSSPLLDLLRDHIMTFFDYAKKRKKDNQFKAGELDELSKIRWFSYDLINLSINNKDHLFFQMGFSLWIRQLYYLSKDINFNKKSLQDHLDFFKKHLIPTVFFGEQITKDTEGYAIYLLEKLQSIFIWILKEDKNFEFLNDFKNMISKIIENRLANFISADHNIIEKAFNNIQSYDSRKLQFLFGLGAYLDGLIKNKSERSDEKKTKFYDLKKKIKDFIMNYFTVHIPLSNSKSKFMRTSEISFDLKNFLNIYPLMNKKEVYKFWGWDFFNMPVDKRWNDDYMEDYFLKLILNVREKRFEELNIDKRDSQILSSLEHLRSTIDKKLKNLNAKEQNKKKIYNLLENISKIQQQKRIDYISKGVLEKSKVQEFINKFEEIFKKHINFRMLFKDEKIIPEIKDKFIRNTNTIEYKRNFMSRKAEPNDLNLHLSNPIDFTDRIPRDLSLDFIVRENEFIQSEILNRCEKRKISYDNFKDKLKNKNWKDSEGLILNKTAYQKITMDLSFYETLKENKLREKSFFNSCFEFKNKKVPFGSYYINEKNIGAIIFDVSKLPKLEMFNPVDPKKQLFEFEFHFEFLPDIGISVGIETFSHNEKLMESMLKKSPDGLTEKKDDKIQRDYLNQMVNIKILQGLYLNWDGIEQIGEAFVITE